jgi:gliding motility-associated-like protein
VPVVQITSLQFVYCIDSNPFSLTATPQPDEGGVGVFTINGNPTPVTQVNPTLLGNGIHTVNYTFTDERTQCVKSASKTFEVSGLPSVSIVSIGAIKDEYCRDETPISLVGIGTPAGGTFSINGIVKTVLNPADTDLRIGTNTILYNYTNANGCTNVASKIVTILPLPVTQITNIKTNYCIQIPAYQLTAIPLGGTFKINEVVSNGIFNPTVLGVGEHKITYTEPKGCVTYTKLVNVYPPIPPLSAMDYAVCSNSGNPEILDGGAGKKYKWTPGNDTTRFKEVFVMGSYSVEVTDSLGCKTINQISVKEDCDPKIFLPTAFTPNGDGLNDDFELKGKDYTNVRAYIYSRWGEVIHASYDRKILWDGNMSNGNPAPDGAYIIDIRYDELPNKIGKQLRRYVVLRR